MAKRYFQHKGLVQSLRKLNQKGGRFSQAAREVEALIGRITQGDEDPFEIMKQTKNGETRIGNCIKYDLAGYARLITVLYANVQVLLFAGSHEDEEAWLDGHRGTTFAIDGSGGIFEMLVSHGAQDGAEVRIAPKADIFHGPVLSRLPYDDLAPLLDRMTGREAMHLHQLMVGATSEMIASYAEMISDSSLRLPMYDVLTQLNAGDIAGAKQRIALMNGEVRKLSELSANELLDVRDGDAVKQIRIGSADYQAWIKNYIESATYYDWFLFMHPEQETFVNTDYSGPAKLSGISGSGKTCIAVRRAIRLAQQQDHSRIAIVTLNRSLAQLIDSLVDHATAADPSLRSKIHITSLFSLCQELLAKFEPENTRLYHDVTWHLEEHIDEVYREYYRLENNFRRGEVMLPLHRQLIANGIDAESYIRDEFDWLRSALPLGARESYLDIERAGRGMRLPSDRRQMVLSGLRGWESKMQDIGVIDYMGLTTSLSRHIESITPKFTSIIIDEVQDFGTTELAILRKLVPCGPNDMFFCGDLAQHILPKHLTFQDAGVDVVGRSFTIRRNYRNSREILKAAYEILYNNLDEAMFKQSELELLDPEYANRSSHEPIVCRASSLEEEIKAALILMRDYEAVYVKQDREAPHRGCIAIAGHTFYEISLFGREHGIPVLDGTVGVKEGALFLSDLEQTKGYEFDTMVVVNCCTEALPPKGVPEDEAFRYGCQLYVAMTRAKDQLVLSYSGEPSHWLTADGVHIAFYEWGNHVDLDAGKAIGVPGYLPERINADNDDVMSLNGRDFLFTPYALGLKPDVQEKVESLVSGQNEMNGRHRVEWKDVGLLLDDLIYGRERGRTGHIFGPVADVEVREALERAKSGLRPVARAPRARTSGKEPAAIPTPVVAPRVKVAAKLEPEALPIHALSLALRTYTILHEMKLRTIGDLMRLGHRGLSRNPSLTRAQTDEIRRAMKRFGKTLPPGEVEGRKRRRSTAQLPVGSDEGY
jgi:UvrD/REP helicase N-terminal domain/UvrD-like helicase C-terminal domain